MTPAITWLYAGLLGLLLLFLSYRVSLSRMKHLVELGDGGVGDLQQRIRVQGNFVEYVPLALGLILLVELSGFSGWIVHLLGAALVVARVLHAQGLSRRPGKSPGRALGALLTWLVIALGSALSILRYFDLRF